MYRYNITGKFLGINKSEIYFYLKQDHYSSKLEFWASVLHLLMEYFSVPKILGPNKVRYVFEINNVNLIFFIALLNNYF
jgi:hypothetical protein